MRTNLWHSRPARYATLSRLSRFFRQNPSSLSVGHADLISDRVEFARFDATSVASAPGMIMMRHRLRIFTGEEDTAQNVAENVTVRLADISQALIDATRWNRTWVTDFADDEIQVSTDLYEILSAYMRLRPGA